MCHNGRILENQAAGRILRKRPSGRSEFGNVPYCFGITFLGAVFGFLIREVFDSFDKNTKTFFVLKEPMTAGKAGVLVLLHIHFCKINTEFLIRLNIFGYSDKIFKHSKVIFLEESL